MQIRQGNKMTALRGAIGFVAENAALLPSVVNAGARTRLSQQIAGLEQSGNSQSGHTTVASGLVKRTAALRNELLAVHMLPISRIAAADLPHTPELAALRMPRSNVTNEQLLRAADGMADAAQLHNEVFIAAGLPDGYIQVLRQAAVDLQASIDSRTSSRGKRNSATQSIKSQLTAAFRTLRVLDALVRKDLRMNSDLLADWETVSTPPTKPGRPSGQEPTTTPSTAPATTPPAVTPNPTPVPAAA